MNTLQSIIIELFNIKLGVSVADKDIERTFHLGTKSVKIRAVLITFISAKTRDFIFTKRSLLQGTNIYRNADQSTTKSSIKKTKKKVKMPKSSETI